MPHVHKSPQAIKRIFVHTLLTPSTFKLKQKQIHAARPLTFPSNSCLGVANFISSI